MCVGTHVSRRKERRARGSETPRASAASPGDREWRSREVARAARGVVATHPEAADFSFGRFPSAAKSSEGRAGAPRRAKEKELTPPLVLLIAQFMESCSCATIGCDGAMHSKNSSTFSH